MTDANGAEGAMCCRAQREDALEPAPGNETSSVCECMKVKGRCDAPVVWKRMCLQQLQCVVTGSSCRVHGCVRGELWEQDEEEMGGT